MSKSKSLYDSMAGQSMMDYNSMSHSAYNGHHEMSMSSKIEMKSQSSMQDYENGDFANGNNNFYSSGDLHLTLDDNKERSWIDPWEISPLNGIKYYYKNLVSPTQQSMMKSIEPDLSSKKIRMGNKTSMSNASNNNNDNYDADDNANKGAKKFGPWDGVMAGCLLNIFGVIMFLRIGT